MSTKKTVIVTGASSGIGFAIAKAYIERGYNVIANSSKLENLEKAYQSLGHPANCHLIAGDISKPETAQHLFQYAEQQFNQVDILINNVGIFISKPFTEYTTLDVDQMFDINLRSFIYSSQAAAQHMSQFKSGHIVTITAALAMQPNAKLPALLPVLTKGGLNSAIKTLALELAPMNIMVNAVAPGVIETPMHGDNEELKTILKSMAPTHRLGQSQDIVDAVLYLTDSTFVTGSILPVDGGSTAGTW
ncbi:SDR family NAD(P)-dependent oxidoreductase [Acinetobacter colistiniresistens]|uniref:SDR family oxidoreductase n=1 Tax=Acinetobacter colistiniresistens TaxID=280145 RepID=A0A558F9E5_9GAMM|nr:SDR family oxidoreductase [Acinetobacter colistiniresistens]TVT82118.1 SDR family oxidoreductase [Acinetobacter colistiniresistens]